MSPRTAQGTLLEQIVTGFRTDGWEVSVSDDQRPFRLTIKRGEVSQDLIVYCWAATHGGGAARPVDEFRIQMTGVIPPLRFSKRAVTLLLGQSEDGLFTAWNPECHRTFTAGSPSLQTSRRAMKSAQTEIFSFHTRSSTEVTVSFVPLMLASYALNQPRLHDAATAVEQAQLVARIVSALAPAQAAADARSSRWDQRHVQTVRAVRERSFAGKVTRAYANACGMCSGNILGVHAAHIVPLAKEWNFDPKNGMALCPTHHAAYDRNLVRVETDYRIAIRSDVVRSLRKNHLAFGEVEAFAGLRPSCACQQTSPLGQGATTSTEPSSTGSSGASERTCYRCRKSNRLRALPRRSVGRYCRMCRLCLSSALRGTGRLGRKLKHSSTRCTCYLCNRLMAHAQFTRRKNGSFISACKERKLAFSHRRRARLLNAVGSCTRVEWKALLSERSSCVVCGRLWNDIPPLPGRGSAIMVDHIVPLSKGGTHFISNLQPLCYRCDSRKSAD